MDYSLESFIDFCDSMIIRDDDYMSLATEKLDTNILDWTLDKNMLLYHGSAEPNLTTISPMSWDMGNRLRPFKKKCSFWTRDFDYAVVWALDWIAMALEVPFFHDIQQKKFIIPGYYTTKCKDTKKEISLYEYILKEVDKRPIYVYEATIPTKHVGRGQFAIDEYTVSIPITPSSMHTIRKKEVEKVLVTASEDEMVKLDRVQYGVFKKPKTNIREKLIFRNATLTQFRRNAQLVRDQRTLAPQTESFINFCEDMII